MKIKELINNTKNNDDDDNDKSKELILKQQIRHHKLHIIRCMLYVLPSYHWSLLDWERNPFLKTRTVNGLMLIESIVAIYQSICNM